MRPDPNPHLVLVQLQESTVESLLNTFAFLNVSQWNHALVVLVRVVLIAAAAWIALGAAQRLIRLSRERIARGMEDPEQVKRAETLGRVFRYVAAVVILVIAAMLILGELGVAVAPILGAAGVVGLAVGFGAQSLVKDYFSGFFILLENQMRQGDVVEIAGKAGLVEEITLRYVRLRDYDGNVHYVANGLITTVTNMSRGYAQSVVDIGVAYRENVDEVLGVMRETGAEMRADPVFGAKILDEIEIAGVDKWADSAVILRCRFRVRPLEQWNVRREFLRRLKNAFDARGIEIPFPHLTVYAGAARDGTAPPFRVCDAGAAAKGE
ncbi:MAG: mechanosensitive ion channel family protein [Betaproteobacteria bacterium]|nr:mechanosensitive ion channel family protein [Betaproteobacteria bacterium]MBI2958719.1 mechanosensitive ion channel family protein [Betaproteobacteria bacterium]